MERRLKERLIGASVLVMLAVIFIPMILDNSGEYDSEISGTNIPVRPEGDFSSRIVPIEDQRVIEQVEPEINNAMIPEAQVATEQPIPVESQEPVQPQSSPTKVGMTVWVVQLGSFNQEENAEKLNQQLRDKGFTAFVEPLSQDAGLVYRVRVGPELLRSHAVELQKKLMEQVEIEGIVVEYP